MKDKYSLVHLMPPFRLAPVLHVKQDGCRQRAASFKRLKD